VITIERKWKERTALAAALLLLAAGLAIPARPARPPHKAKPVQQAQEGPLTGRVILVDPGHGGTDGGARARQSGIWEKELNLQVACQVRYALEEMGAQVIMSRETDMEYSQNKRQDLTARLDLARQGQADMLLSIHMNEYHNAVESGPQVFYRKGQEHSRLLAGALQEALIDGLQPVKKRAALSGDYFMLSLDIPSVLVECGFLSNAAEESLLRNAAYQQKIGKAIAKGVAAYYALSDP